MGNNFANEMANGTLADLGIHLTLEQQIGYHLSGNFFPPVPLSMVQPCVDAINAYWNDCVDEMIPMPEGVTYKGADFAPAWAIIEQHHLEEWAESYDDDYGQCLSCGELLQEAEKDNSQLCDPCTDARSLPDHCPNCGEWLNKEKDND